MPTDLKPVSLAALLPPRRAALLSTLSRARSTRDSAKALTDALDDITAEALPNLALADGRAADTLLQGVRLALQSLAADARITAPHVAPSARAATPIVQTILTALQVAACAVILFAPINPPPLVWFIVLALGVLLAIELLLQIWHRVPTHLRAAVGDAALSSPATPRPSDPLITLDPKTLADRLHDALELVDRVLAERAAATPAPKALPGLSNYVDLLELLQTMSGVAATGRADLLPVMAGQIGTTLRRHQLQLRHFSPSMTDDERAAFDLEPDVTGQLRAPRGELPALISGGQIILRGRVIIPRP